MGRFQAYQTRDDKLTVRLRTRPDADPETVWQRVEQRIRRLFDANDAEGVRIQRAAERPQRDARSQKSRTIWDARRRA